MKRLRLAVVVALLCAFALVVTPAQAGSITGCGDEIAVLFAQEANYTPVQAPKVISAADESQSLLLELLADEGGNCETSCTGYCGAGGCCSCFCGGFFNYCYWYCCSHSPE